MTTQIYHELCVGESIMQYLPPNNCITLAHIPEIVQKFPHTWVFYADLVDIYGKEREACTAHQV